MATAFNVKGNDELGALLQPRRPGLFKEEHIWWHFGSGIRPEKQHYGPETHPSACMQVDAYTLHAREATDGEGHGR